MTNPPADSRVLCRRCRKGHLALQATHSFYEHDGSSLPFADEFMRCDNCGHESYTRNQSLARSSAITAAVRKAENLLTGDEIRAIRVSYRLSLPDFERALGVGKNTVGRWERGTVPPASSANLGLWIAKNKRSAFIEWARTRGVNISAQHLDSYLLETSASASLSGTMELSQVGSFGPAPVPQIKS